MVEENKNISFKFWLMKSGLAVVALSIGGYALGFIYETGYASYFEIPSKLIKPDSTSTFLAIIGLISISGLLLFVTQVTQTILVGRTGRIAHFISNTAPFLLFFVGCFYIKLYIGTLLFLIITTIFVYGFLNLTDYILQRISRSRKNEQQSKFIMDHIWQNKTVLIIIKPIMIFIVICIFVGLLGEAEAHKQKTFLVIREPQPLVVLRIYGDKFVCAPFDSKAGTVEKSFYILEAPKQGGLWLDWKPVGPLKPVDKKVTDVNK